MCSLSFVLECPAPPWDSASKKVITRYGFLNLQNWELIKPLFFIKLLGLGYFVIVIPNG